MTYARNLGWNEDELRIWDLQYKSQPIKFIPEESLKPHCISLLFKISIITGWNAPESTEERRVLNEQFRLKMQEEYYALNVEEIEYAFRSEGTKVKDWGKSINLSLIDEVLQPYILRRAEIRKLESSAIKPQIEAPPPEPLNEDEFINTAKNIFKKTGKKGLISTMVYDILLKRGDIEISLEEKKELFAKMEQVKESQAMASGLDAMKELKLLKKSAERYKEEIGKMCKQEIVAEYFITSQIDEL